MIIEKSVYPAKGSPVSLIGQTIRNNHECHSFDVYRVLRIHLSHEHETVPALAVLV